MADDDEIDIEEHDVLDNPALRDIFPNMSLFKLEIDNFEGIYETIPPDDDASTFTKHQVNVEVVSEGKDEALEHNQLPVQANAEVIEINDEEDITFNSELTNQPININKIMLGSKPSKSYEFEEELFEERVKCYNVNVVLDDLKSYLGTSERFCKKCLILFPDKLSLDNHEENYHVKERNSALEQTSNNSGNVNSGAKVNNTSVKCSKCNNLFTCRSSLYKHIKQFHNDKPQINIHNMIPRVKDDTKNNKHQENNVCFHCKKSFITQKSLIEHLYSILQAKKNVYECKICSSSFSDVEALNTHVVTHKTCAVILNDVAKEVENPISTSNKPTKEIQSKILGPSESQNADTLLNPKIKMAEHRNICQSEIGYYRCYICSYYFTTTKPYLKHLALKHNVSSYCNQQEKEDFDSKCKYCSNNYYSLLSYNNHLGLAHKEHYNSSGKQTLKKPEALDHRRSIPVNAKQEKHIEKTNAEKNNDVVPQFEPLLKSALFKCSKCDIHFLSSKIAKNHTEHIEMLINWKCSICQRIFKNEDKIVHGEQHKYSRELLVYDLCPNASAPILFHCLNCKVHFDEDTYFKHHSTCQNQTTNSVFCIICDVFIDSSISKMHRTEHVTQNIKSTDYVIVESDVLVTCNSNPKMDENSETVTTKTPSKADKGENTKLKRKRIGNSDIPHNKKDKNSDDLLNLTYCYTCKCFLTKQGELHLDQRCKRLIKCVCTICGLTLTNKSFESHSELHETRKNVKLGDFNFFDVQSGKKICPPVPEYPKCNRCHVHFASKGAHKCNATEHLTCHLCNITLTEDAFRLHILFHNYFKTGVQSQQASSSTEKESIKQCVDLEGIIYQCKNCCISLDSYDKVVEHCQEHYYNEEESTETVKCRICELTFEKSCIDRHIKMHKTHKKKDWFTILTFDIFYFTSENNTWIKHVFETIPENQREEIVNESIYKNECRIKMEVIQNGNSDFTVYKCDKCRSFIDESGLYKHAENACFKLRKHPCTICGLPYNSSVSRIQHERVHEKPNINLKTYRIVTFNKEEDKTLNKLLYCRSQYYILYQCRNCSIALDKSQTKKHTNCSGRNLKSCSACGLLISNDDFDAHILRHKELSKFIQKNIKIILFGEVTETVKEKEIVSLFPGIVYDYTFYSCSKCEVCLKSQDESHSCSFGSNRLKCSICKLYFATSKLKHHVKLHERDPDFLRSNMRIIKIDSLEDSSNSTNEEVESFPLSKETNDNNDQQLPHKEKRSKVEVKEEDAKIFKCICGLHFLDQITVLSHMKKCDVKSRAAKQKCTKCGLLFTQNILFNHLILHHGNKLNVYKFQIIDMTSYTIIFRCVKCNLHFEQLNEINDHVLGCDGITDGKDCIFCCLKFESMSFLAHDCSNVNNVNAGFEVIDLGEPLVLSSAFAGLRHGINKQPKIAPSDDTEEEISNKDFKPPPISVHESHIEKESIKGLKKSFEIPSSSGENTLEKIADPASKQSDLVTSSALENADTQNKGCKDNQEQSLKHNNPNVNHVAMDIDEQSVPDSASDMVLDSSNESTNPADPTEDIEPVGSSSDAAPIEKINPSDQSTRWHQDQRGKGIRSALLNIPCSEFSYRIHGSPRDEQGSTPRNGFRGSRRSGYRGRNYIESRGGKYGTPRGGKYGTPRGGKYGTPRGGKYGTPRGGKYGTPRGGKYGASRGSNFDAPRGRGANYDASRGRGANYGAPRGKIRGAFRGQIRGAPGGTTHGAAPFVGNYDVYNPHGEPHYSNQGDSCGNYDVDNSHYAPGNNDHGFEAQSHLPTPTPEYWPYNLLHGFSYFNAS